MATDDATDDARIRGARVSEAHVSEAHVSEALRMGDLRIEGMLPDASNATVRCLVDVDGHEVRCVYKPVRGERPLWDFPTGTLGRREVALAALAEAVGWQLVPPTVWRDDGPLGPGMCQLWVDVDDERTGEVIDVFVVGDLADGALPAGWREVVSGRDGAGRDVVVAHRDTDVLQRFALLDAIANNADRKGGHLIADASGRVWGIDHGVTFNVEPKLRTVLWGWVGAPIPDAHAAALARAREVVADPPHELATALDADEIAALRARVDALMRTGTFPQPSTDWPALPWPLF